MARRARGPPRLKTDGVALWVPRAALWVDGLSV